MRSAIRFLIRFTVSNLFLFAIFLLGLFHHVKAHLLFLSHIDKPLSYPAITFKKRVNKELLEGGKDSVDEKSESDHRIVYDRYVTAKGKKNITAIDNAEGNLNTTNLKLNFFSSAKDEHQLLICDLAYYLSKMNIDMETFMLETKDGFYIELWHLIPKKINNSLKDENPILYIHGLMQSGASIISGGKNSIGYHLHSQGHDIWLANNRCGFNPIWNIDKLQDSHDKWNWDINELVNYDIPCFINNVLLRTNKKKLNLIAHSQGTTQTLISLKKNIDNMSNKIDKIFLLSPAVFPGDLVTNRSYMKFLSILVSSDLLTGGFSSPFLPMIVFVKKYFVSPKIFSYISYFMFNFLFTWDDSLWDKNFRDIHFLFSPTQISNKLMNWWLTTENFTNLFPEDKQWFNTTNSKDYPQIYMFVPRQENLVDIHKLINHFINYEDNITFNIWLIDEYNHMDVLWAKDVVNRIGIHITKHLKI